MKFLPILRRKFLPCVAIAFALALAPAKAQDASPEVENSAAVKVVREYMKCMLEQNWSRTAEIVENKSLEDLKRDYVRRIKQSATLDEERAVLGEFNVKTLEDIEKLSGKQFYITYHEVLKTKKGVNQEIMQKVKETMKLRVLSLCYESDSLAHVLVRTKHSTDKATVENLELISLIKQGDRWLVGLNEQTPKITPLAAGGGASATPAPAPEKPAPAPTPAEPAKKPATAAPKGGKQK